MDWIVIVLKLIGGLGALGITVGFIMALRYRPYAQPPQYRLELCRRNH